MTRPSFALSFAALLTLTTAGCSCGGERAEDAGMDSALDADVDLPLTLSASSDDGALSFDTTGGLVLRDSSGQERLRAAVGSAFSYGVSGGGDMRYHDVTSSAPRGVTFNALTHGVEQVDPATGLISDHDGHVARITLDAPAPRTFRLRLTPESGEETVALTRLSLDADDGSYQGLGERFGHADARGSVVPMQLGLGGTRSGTNEHHVPVPLLVSSKGYGVFVKSREAGAFDVAASDPDHVHARFEGATLEIYFFVAPTTEPASVLRAYAELTGLPRLPPRWASAPMYWRNAWTDSDDLRTAAARLRAEDIPTTSFWIDNPWEASYNDHVFDSARFPDAPTLLTEMQAMGYSPLLWSTPYLDAVDEGASPANEAERLFVEARDRGLLVKQGGSPFISPAAPGAPGAMMDFTNAEAVSFWQTRLDPLVAMGVRAFKLDFAEEVMPELLGARPGLEFSDGTTERETHNVYATLYHTPYRQALDEGPTHEGFLLVRAEAWGGQSVADIIWPGDLDSDMREGLDGEVGGLPAAITALISLSASGFPSFASDTGGFRDGMPSRETLLRWAEHTAFSPFLQLGGGGDHHDPWLYDAEAGAIYHTLARAHMQLVPYLRALAIRASTTGLPPVLAPALAYPDDRAGYGDPYAYLLGDDLFVAPVVTEGATTRALHLPPGAWLHWFTGERFTGASDVTIDAPIGQPPVFIRVGAILPMLPRDLDTLVETPDPEVVDPTQRPWLRALIIPGAAHTIATEEGVNLTSERVTDGVDLDLTFATDGLRDLRMRVLLGEAEPVMDTVSSVTVDGSPVSASADVATVEGGCDGACWAMDGTQLVLSVRGVDAAHVEVR